MFIRHNDTSLAHTAQAIVCTLQQSHACHEILIFVSSLTHRSVLAFLYSFWLVSFSLFFSPPDAIFVTNPIQCGPPDIPLSKLFAGSWRKLSSSCGCQWCSNTGTWIMFSTSDHFGLQSHFSITQFSILSLTFVQIWQLDVVKPLGGTGDLLRRASINLSPFCNQQQTLVRLRASAAHLGFRSEILMDEVKRF